MDSIAPIEQSGNEAQAGEEVAGELVVACGDGAEVLEPAVGALDDVAPLVALCIEREDALAVRFVGDHGDGAAAVEQCVRAFAVGWSNSDRRSLGLCGGAVLESDRWHLDEMVVGIAGKHM